MTMINIKEKDILILSGEGSQGTWERYFGKRTPKALKAKLTRERSHSDRWVRVFIHQHDDVYAEMDHSLTELVAQREVPQNAIYENPAAKMGAARSEKKAAAARENGKKGGRPRKAACPGALITVSEYGSPREVEKWAFPDKDSPCCFEEYSKEKHSMVNCGEPSIGEVGGHNLCREHFA